MVVELDGDAGFLDPHIERFVEYWASKRGAGQYPARAHLDPLDFVYVWGDVVVIEARRNDPGTEGPWSFRYRVIGSKLADRDGYDLTNQSIDAIPEPQYRNRVRATWTKVCERGRGIHRVRDFVLDYRRRRYEVVVLPLASNGNDIDMLISVQRPLPEPETAETFRETAGA